MALRVLFAVSTVLLSWIHGTIASELCPLNDYDCSQFGVSCRIVRDPGCALVSEVTSPGDHYPAPVTDLAVRPYYQPSPDKADSISRTDITWGLPGYDTDKYLTGFEVQIVHEQNPPYCFIFNISGAALLRDDKEHFRLALNCSVLHKGGYTVNVASLPASPYSHMVGSAMLKIVWKQRDKSPDHCRASNDTLCWDTDIVIYNDACTRTIRVVFTQAPERYGRIELYQIALMIKGGIEADTSTDVMTKPGEQFLEGILNISGLQLPMNNRYVRVISRGSACQGNKCRDSLSQTFDIVEATEEECAVSVPPAVEADVLGIGALTGIIVGVVVLAGLVTGIIIALARSRTKAPSGSRPVDYEQDVDSINSIRSAGPLIRESAQTRHVAVSQQKIVYLLYSNDSPFHMNVVGFLAQFLNTNNCEVIFDKMCAEDPFSQIRADKTAWIKRSMDKSDHILLITSEGTFRKLTGQYCTYFDNEVSFLGDMFTPGMLFLERDQEALGHKVILCYFEYTHEDFIGLPNTKFQERPKYRLTAHMDDLLKHINSTEENVLYLPDTGLSREGDALENAIRHAIHFLKTDRQQGSSDIADANLWHGPNPTAATEETNRQSMLRGYVPPVPPDDITTVDGSSIVGLVSDINTPKYDSGYQTASNGIRTMNGADIDQGSNGKPFISDKYNFPHRNFATHHEWTNTASLTRASLTGQMPTKL